MPSSTRGQLCEEKNGSAHMTLRRLGFQARARSWEACQYPYDDTREQSVMPEEQISGKGSQSSHYTLPSVSGGQ